MRADSLALDSPGQPLKEVRGFGKAWLGGSIDSASKDRDWMRGDTVVALFTPSRLGRQEARGAEPDRGPGGARSPITWSGTPRSRERPSINYARGDAITVTMKTAKTPGSRRRRSGRHPGQGGRHPARGQRRHDRRAATARRAPQPGRRSGATSREPMTAPEWIGALGDRDPSVAIALAAITRAAGPSDVVPFADLVMGYREAHLACYRTSGTAQEQEITGDEIREHLTGSVLPRLAIEGWILETSASGWDPVQPRVAWWGTEVEDRQGDLRRAALGRPAGRPADQAARRRSGPRPACSRARTWPRASRAGGWSNDVSVRVEQGEIVGLLGPNGAGKTTTFYLITGLIRPDAGRVRLDGRDLTRAPMYRAGPGRDRLPRAGALGLPQDDGRGEHSGDPRDPADLGRDERHRQLDRMLDELSIKHLRRSRAYSLSGGERRRLEITRALVTDPKFMLLDEPFAGVDPIAVHDIQTIVAGLRHRGIGVLITDHNVEQTLDIVDRAYIMFEGKVQAAGTVRELVYDDRVAQLYLGPTLTARLRARLEAVA